MQGHTPTTEPRSKPRFRDGLNHGIKRRWFLNNISVVLVAMILLVVSVGVGVTNYYYSTVQSGLETRANTTAKYINRYMSFSYAEFYEYSFQLVQEFSDADKIEMQILDFRGRIMFSSIGLTAGARPSTTEVDRAIVSGKTVTDVGKSNTTGEKLVASASPIYDHNNRLIGAVRYVSSTRKLDGQLMRIYLGLVAITAFIAAMIVTSNLFFLRSIVNPILQINQLAQKITSGQYGARLDVAFNDEIGELCSTLNRMSEELARMEKVKNDFISSVSHELRTPLTAINGWTETLMNVDDVKLRGDGLRIVQKETLRLSQMVEELLDFSRMESGRLRLQTEPVDLRGELYDAVFTYGDMLRQQGLLVNYTEPEDALVVNADRNRMKQVFLNVIDNAGKYGQDGDHIDVSMQQDAGNCVVTIQDYGQGIPAEELPRVKEKFFKGSAKGRGTGIGLAVCNEIVEMHGGTLEVESEVGSGTRVIIHLPLMEPGGREEKEHERTGM